jgi:hypothetical protein
MTADTTRARQLADQAWEALNDSEVPRELYPAAFGSIYAFLAQDGPAAATPNNKKSPGGGGEAPGEGGLSAIAEKLGIEEEDASYLFDIEGRDLYLTVSRDRLAKDRADAMREVAFLVVAGRQAAGLDTDRTDSGHVRTQGVHLNVMNKNTFREEMGKLSPYITAKNSGRFARSLKMTRGGFDEAAKLAKRIIIKSNASVAQ